MTVFLEGSWVDDEISFCLRRFFGSALPQRLRDAFRSYRGEHLEKLVWEPQFFSFYNLFRGLTTYLYRVYNLDGGFKHFLCSPLFGEVSNLTSIFFRWVGFNHQLAGVGR